MHHNTNCPCILPYMHQTTSFPSITLPTDHAPHHVSISLSHCERITPPTFHAIYHICIRPQPAKASHYQLSKHFTIYASDQHLSKHHTTNCPRTLPCKYCTIKLKVHHNTNYVFTPYHISISLSHCKSITKPTVCTPCHASISPLHCKRITPLTVYALYHVSISPSKCKRITPPIYMHLTICSSHHQQSKYRTTNRLHTLPWKYLTIILKTHHTTNCQCTSQYMHQTTSCPKITPPTFHAPYLVNISL